MNTVRRAPVAALVTLSLAALARGQDVGGAAAPDAAAQPDAAAVIAALERGDAAAARAVFEPLRDAAPEAPETHRLGYLVACAAGDAQLAEQMLRRRSREAEGDARRAISRQRRCMRSVGGPAAELELETAAGRFHTVRRGDRALVLHFWASNAEPQPDEALAELHAWGREHGYVDFVGVNSDGKADTRAAEAFAAEHGYTWPQHYEGVARDAPITHQAFKVGSPGWLVVIDSYGYVRVAGDADDPGVGYGLRAAAEEAAGRYERVRTRSRDGTEAPRALTAKPSRPAPQVAEGDGARPPGKGDLPSDPAAADLVRQGRLFMRTGNKTKAKELFERVLREYPGTREALQAEEYLQVLP